MPVLTPNLKLKKTIWDKEPADIRVFNENLDIIDENFIKKFDKAGGTITDDVVMQKDLVVNGTTSTNALILNGWKITIK